MIVKLAAMEKTLVITLKQKKTDSHKAASIAISKGQTDCKECGKQFSSRQILERHIMVHTGEEPFECEVCGKRFPKIFSMKRHQVTHTGEKPFSCYCGINFTLEASLKRHEQKFHSVDQ